MDLILSWRIASFKSVSTTELKKVEQQPAAGQKSCQQYREDNTTCSPSCQGQDHSQLDHTWSPPARVYACVCVCVCACICSIGCRRFVWEPVYDWRHTDNSNLPSYNCIFSLIPFSLSSSLPLFLLHLSCLSLLLVAARGSGPENSHQETNPHLHITALFHVCHERIN